MNATVTENQWHQVKRLLGNSSQFEFMKSFDLPGLSPKLLPLLSCYKFAAKMIGRPRRVLDVGCGIGLGTWILAKECGDAAGIDKDPTSIELAKDRWPAGLTNFRKACLSSIGVQDYDAVTCIKLDSDFEETVSCIGALAGSIRPGGVAVLACSSSEMRNLDRALGAYFPYRFPFYCQGGNVLPGTRPNSEISLRLMSKESI